MNISEKSYVAARKQPIPEAVTLYIYAADSKRVAKIMKEFTTFVNGKFITKSVQHMNKLSDEEVTRKCRKMLFTIYHYTIYFEKEWRRRRLL